MSIAFRASLDVEPAADGGSGDGVDTVAATGAAGGTGSTLHIDVGSNSNSNNNNNNNNSDSDDSNTSRSSRRSNISNSSSCSSSSSSSNSSSSSSDDDEERRHRRRRAARRRLLDSSDSSASSSDDDDSTAEATADEVASGDVVRSLSVNPRAPATARRSLTLESPVASMPATPPSVPTRSSTSSSSQERREEHQQQQLESQHSPQSEHLPPQQSPPQRQTSDVSTLLRSPSGQRSLFASAAAHEYPTGIAPWTTDFGRIDVTDNVQCMDAVVNGAMIDQMKSFAYFLYGLTLPDSQQSHPETIFQVLRATFALLSAGESLIRQVKLILINILAKLEFDVEHLTDHKTLCERLLEAFDLLILLQSLKEHKCALSNDFALFSRLFSLKKASFADDDAYLRRMNKFLYKMKLCLTPEAVPGVVHRQFFLMRGLVDSIAAEDVAMCRKAAQRIVDVSLNVLEHEEVLRRDREKKRRETRMRERKQLRKLASQKAKLSARTASAAAHAPPIPARTSTEKSTAPPIVRSSSDISYKSSVSTSSPVSSHSPATARSATSMSSSSSTSSSPAPPAYVPPAEAFEAILRALPLTRYQRVTPFLLLFIDAEPSVIASGASKGYNMFKIDNKRVGRLRSYYSSLPSYAVVPVYDDVVVPVVSVLRQLPHWRERQQLPLWIHSDVVVAMSRTNNAVKRSKMLSPKASSLSSSSKPPTPTRDVTALDKSLTPIGVIDEHNDGDDDGVDKVASAAVASDTTTHSLNAADVGDVASAGAAVNVADDDHGNDGGNGPVLMTTQPADEQSADDFDGKNGGIVDDDDSDDDDVSDEELAAQIVMFSDYGRLDIPRRPLFGAIDPDDDDVDGAAAAAAAAAAASGSTSAGRPFGSVPETVPDMSLSSTKSLHAWQRRDSFVGGDGEVVSIDDDDGHNNCDSIDDASDGGSGGGDVDTRYPVLRDDDEAALQFANQPIAHAAMSSHCAAPSVCVYNFTTNLFPLATGHIDCKLVLMGDVKCGKSLLLMTGLRLLSAPQHQWQRAAQLPRYVPSVFDVTRTRMTVAGWHSTLSLWDVSGDVSYEPLYPMLFAGANCVFLCFSLADEQSLVSVRERWLSVRATHVPSTVPTLLVGLQSDARCARLTRRRCLVAAKRMHGVCGYVECSVLDVASIRRALAVGGRLALLQRAAAFEPSQKRHRNPHSRQHLDSISSPSAAQRMGMAAATLSAEKKRANKDKRAKKDKKKKKKKNKKDDVGNGDQDAGDGVSESGADSGSTADDGCAVM